MPRAEARERIVGAAERLLAGRPWSELSVDAVMAEAGLARTVFYRHFDDLPALLLGMVSDVAGELFGAIARSREHDGPAAFVRATLDHAVRAYCAHGPLLAALDDAARTDDRVREAYCAIGDRSTALTAELLEAGAAAGHNRAFPHPAEAARALTEMNNAYLLATLGRAPRADPEVVRATLVDLWESVLRRP